MKRIFATLIAFVVALPAWAAIEIKEVTSPGGIAAWLVEDHSIPFTALELRFRGGTSLDEPDKRGAIYLMSAFVSIVILVLLVGGLGLFLRSLRKS